MMCPRIMDATQSDASHATITSSEPSPQPSGASLLCPAKQSPILLAKLQGCPMGYQKPSTPHRNSNSSAEDEMTPRCPNASVATITHPNIPAGTTITAVTRPVASANRKLDSPTDSGIESGSDGSSIGTKLISSGSSSCSSPRSTLEDHPMQQSLAETLPTLKRALEKPAIFDPHMYHKKFRRNPSDLPQGPLMHHHLNGHQYQNGESQLQSILTSGRSMTPSQGLAMTHSNLADRLKMAPKMSDEQRKNQELLNRFIDQGGVIKSSKEVMAKVQIAAVDQEGAPLNLSKKTAATIGSGEDAKIMVEA